MINNKKDFREYLFADFSNNSFSKFKNLDLRKKYLTILRKTELYLNTKHRILSFIYLYKLKKLSFKTSTHIPPNCFGPGLSIAHLGCIYVHNSVRAGKNCRIHETVTIGATNGENQAAIIGDNVFIGSGAKIIGNIKIADNVAIGAGAVVVKDINEPSTTWGGVPAKKISNNDSHSNLKVFKNE